MFACLILCLVFVGAIESNVIKQYPLSPEGLEFDVELKNKDSTLWKMQIDVDERAKIVRLTRKQPLPPQEVGGTPSPDKKIDVDSRFGIRNGPNRCPTGYEQRGTFCFPADDY